MVIDMLVVFLMTILIIQSIAIIIILLRNNVWVRKGFERTKYYKKT